MDVTLYDLHYYMNPVNFQHIYIFIQKLIARMQGPNSDKVSQKVMLISFTTITTVNCHNSYE